MQYNLESSTNNFEKEFFLVL